MWMGWIRLSARGWLGLCIQRWGLRRVCVCVLSDHAQQWRLRLRF